MPRRMGARCERQPSRLEMKKLFLTGVAALSVFSASAQARWPLGVPGLPASQGILEPRNTLAELYRERDVQRALAAVRDLLHSSQSCRRRGNHLSAPARLA